MDNYARACPHTCECVSFSVSSSSSSGSSLSQPRSEINGSVRPSVENGLAKNADAQTTKLKLLSGFLCLLILFFAWQLNR